MCLKNAGRNFIKILDGKNPLKSDLILEKKYAPALDNYGLLLQFWSYSFNILYDDYTHNGGVHVHMMLMVRWWHHLCLTDTLHFLKITPNKTTLSIIIKCRGILLF
jgi:hypothetical protein